VRRYVPELRLADEQAAAKVTVLQLGGNGILLEHHVGRFVADAEAIYSYEGTREMNTLIVGRAITGLSAFV
jgi:alkylation response protein AidB-like acyl-CoA dehydrogenase